MKIVHKQDTGVINDKDECRIRLLCKVILITTLRYRRDPIAKNCLLEEKTWAKGDGLYQINLALEHISAKPTNDTDPLRVVAEIEFYEEALFDAELAKLILGTVCIFHGALDEAPDNYFHGLGIPYILKNIRYEVLPLNNTASSA